MYTVSKKCATIHCVQEKRETKTFCLISPIKLRRFWWNLVHHFLNKFASKWCKHFPANLSNVSVSSFTLWNLKCSSYTCYRWVVTERNSRIYPTSTVASKFARFESSWKQYVGNVAREGVRNTHHCCGAINDASDKLLPRWRHSPALGLIASLCSQSLFQFVQVSDSCFVHLLQ